MNSPRTLIGWGGFFNYPCRIILVGWGGFFSYLLWTFLVFIISPLCIFELCTRKVKISQWSSWRTRFNFRPSPCSKNSECGLHSSLPTDIRDHESQNCSHHRYDFGFAVEARQTRPTDGDCQCLDKIVLSGPNEPAFRTGVFLESINKGMVVGIVSGWTNDLVEIFSEGGDTYTDAVNSESPRPISVIPAALQVCRQKSKRS